MTLSAIEKEVVEMFDKIFQGLPKNWCPNCHTLGTAFPNDTICGNCNYPQIGTFESFLTSALRRVAEGTFIEIQARIATSKNMSDEIGRLAWNACNAEMQQNFIKFTEKV